MSEFLLRLAPALLIAFAALSAHGQAATSPATEGTPAVSAAAPAPAPAKLPAPENKWRIQCSEGANSDGELVFRVTPKGGAPTDVTVAVKNGTSENNVADNIRDAFRAQLPKDTYTAEIDDGEDVLLKRRMGKPNFSLQVLSNSVNSVRLNVDRE